MRSLISATSVLALALCFQTAATSMAAADDAGGGDIGINITDEYGQRTWYGSESPEVTALADQAEVFAQSHSDTVLGVALTSDRQMVELFVISSDIDGLDELVSLDPHRIRVVVNENSPEQVDAAQEQVLGLDWDALNIESVAPDPVGDGIEVVVSDDGDVAASDVRDGTGFGDMEQELTGALGDLGVPIRISVEEPEDPAAT
ncbi:hypothetical protein [Actinomyces procaprae]|uniref:hypothetical protein n=1 Tax=Actinomyces procaprae TaxID=2560010 RepID=UPI0010A21231|nr:hypothetical protein [Actinomyces procaprae]